MEEEIALILRKTVDEYGRVYEVLAAKKIIELIESKKPKQEPPDEVKETNIDPAESI